MLGALAVLAASEWPKSAGPYPPAGLPIVARGIIPDSVLTGTYCLTDKTPLNDCEKSKIDKTFR